MGEYPPPEASVNSVNSVGGLAQANSEWFCGRNLEGGVGMAGMPYPPTSVKICAICGRISSTRSFCEFREFRGRTCVNKLGVGSVEGIRRAAWVWQPQNYLPTEFAEHTETTGGEEKSVYICEIRGRLFSARSVCVFCEFCGRTCANKLGMGSVEGIWRAAWVWQGCHTLLRKLPRIARMCTD